MAIGNDARATFLAIVKGDASQAVTEFKKLGNTVEKSTTQASTSTSKFGSLASKAMAEVKANAGALALGGAAAVGAFAISAANQFAKVAKAALDLSKATGLSVEEASRWIAVGDDYGVTADNIASALGRVAKDLDADKWAKYGIATRDASGEARDANAIFLDVLDVLNRTPNETERARKAAELLGRGWQSISPLLGKSRSEYEKLLGSVEKGQVITAQEAKRAEEWRLAVDELQDAFRELVLSLGKSVVPTLGKLADAATGVLNVLVKLQEASNAGNGVGDPIDFDVTAAAKSLEEYNRVLEQLVQSGWSEKQAAALLTSLGITRDAAEAQGELNKKLTEGVNGPSGWMPYAKAVDGARAKLHDVNYELETLKRYLDELNREDAQLNLEQQFIDLKDAADEAFYAAVSGSEVARDKAIDYQLALNDIQREFADYATDVRGLPPSVTTDILTRIESGELDTYQKVLDEMKKQYDVYVRVHFQAPNITVKANGDVVGLITTVPGKLQTYAQGTNYAPEGYAMVGERGPELVRMGGGERVYTANQTRKMLTSAGGMGGASVTNIYNLDCSNKDEAEIVRMLKEYERRNGSW